MSFTEGFQAGMMARRQREQRKLLATQREDENKQISGQIKALETYLPAVGRELGFSSEEIDAMLAQSPDQSPRQRHAQLSQFLKEGVALGNQREQALRNQKLQAEIDAHARSQADMQRINRNADMQNMLASVGSGSFESGLNPSAAAEAARYAQSPAGRLRQQGVTLTPQMLAEIERYSGGADRLGEVIDIEGQKYVRTNKNQITALPKGKNSNTADAPKVVTVDGRQYFQPEPGAPFRLVSEPAQKPVDPTAQAMKMGQYTRKLQAIETLENTSKWFEGGKREKDQELTKLRREANVMADAMGYAMPFPEAQPAAKNAAPGAAPAKLYRVQNNQVSIDPKARPIDAIQQAVDDGVITQDQAIQHLEQIGYKRKK